jgi:hypothetical protein
MTALKQVPPLAEETKKKDVEHVNLQDSTKKGVWKVVENILRQYQNFFFPLFLAPMALFYAIAITVAVTPGIFIFAGFEQWTQGSASWVIYLGRAFSVGLGFIGFIVSLLIVVPILNLPFRFFVKSYKGPWFSLESIPWYYHNALLYLVRYTVLDFVTPSPLNILFFKAMGMKIGKGSMINTSNVSDACLIEIGNYVTIGGSTYMMAHYGVKGYLIIDRLKIKDKAMIGLAAKILGGVQIGERAIVAPNSVLLPKTNIPDGEKFGY